MGTNARENRPRVKILLVFFILAGYLGVSTVASPIHDGPAPLGDELHSSSDILDDDAAALDDEDVSADMVDGHNHFDDGNGGGPNFLQIIDDLKHTAAEIEEQDLAGVDVSHKSQQFITEEAIASLIKAIHARILHSQVKVGIAVKQHIASEIERVEDHLDHFENGDAEAEQEIATEIHQVEEHLRTLSSETAESDAEQEVADTMKNIGGHIDQINLGHGDSIEEEEIAKEIHRVGDALETALTGKGTEAEEADLAGQIKRMKTQLMPEEASVIKEQETSTEKLKVTQQATEETTDESTIGGLLHSVAGLFSGNAGKNAEDVDTDERDDVAGEVTQKETATGADSVADNSDDSDEEDDDPFYDDAFMQQEDERDSSKSKPDDGIALDSSSKSSLQSPSSDAPTKTEGSKPVTNPLDDLDDDDYDYHPITSESSDATNTKEVSSSLDDQQAQRLPSGGRTWHITAMTVVMCGVVGVVMLTVVGLWYRRFSFRGGLPAAAHSVIEDDEDAVYTATTQREPQLGRYSKLQ